MVSTPAIATAGYAVGASGAIFILFFSFFAKNLMKFQTLLQGAVGGQAPATIAAPAPVVAYNAG